MKNERKSAHSPKHVSFFTPSAVKAQSFAKNQENVNPNSNQIYYYNPQNNESSTNMTHSASSPSICSCLSTSISSNDSNAESENSFNSRLDTKKTISSNETLQFSGQRNIEAYSSCDNGFNKINKKISFIMPANTKNKMPLRRTCQISVGRQACKNNISKIDVNGEKVYVGHGFPSKTPIITDSNSQIIKNAEKNFNILEDEVQKIKNESVSNKSDSNDIFKIMPTTDNESNLSLSKKEEIKNLNNRISNTKNDIDLTVKEYVKMEANILNDFTEINSSINQLLDERKEMQMQHRIFLQNMKKKIYQTREKVKKI